MSSYIDLILIIFIVYSLYQGYQTGFLVSLSKLLFILLGILLSLFLAIKLKKIIYPGLIASPYIAIVILTLIFATIFRMLIKKFIAITKNFLSKTDLIWLNPVFGAALGIVKAYLIVFVLISIIGSFNNRTIMTPILHSKIAFHIYSQVKQITGFNLMKYLHDLSLKDTAKQVTQKMGETLDQIEK